MHAQLEAETLRGAEDRSRFIGCENAGFAEHITPLGKLLVPDRGQHLLDDERDVLRAPVPVLDRDLVRTHERGGQARSAAASSSMRMARSMRSSEAVSRP